MLSNVTKRMRFNVTRETFKIFISNENVWIRILDILEAVVLNGTRLVMRTAAQTYVLIKHDPHGMEVLHGFIQNITRTYAGIQ